MSDSVPDLLVEKLALGELEDGKATAVRKRLGDAADQTLSSIEASNAEILRELAPEDFARTVKRRAEIAEAPSRQAVNWTPWFAAAGLAAAAVLLWSVVGPTDGPPQQSPLQQAQSPTEAGPTKLAQAEPRPAADDGAIRFKGGTKLSIFRAASGQADQLAAGDRVHQGDRLQVSYAAGDATHGVIVSVDGAGAATLHFPASVDGDTSLRGRAQLPHGYELDDAPGFERFFFVTSDEAEVSVATVMAAARALAKADAARDSTLILPEGLQQQTVLLLK